MQEPRIFEVLGHSPSSFEKAILQAIRVQEENGDKVERVEVKALMVKPEKIHSKIYLLDYQVFCKLICSDKD